MQPPGRRTAEPRQRAASSRGRHLLLLALLLGTAGAVGADALLAHPARRLLTTSPLRRPHHASALKLQASAPDTPPTPVTASSSTLSHSAALPARPAPAAAPARPPAPPPAGPGPALAALGAALLLGAALALRAVWAVLQPPAPRIAMMQFGKFRRTREEIEEEEFVDDEDETYMGYYPPSPDDTDEDNDEELKMPPMKREVVLEEFRLQEYLPAQSTPLEAVGDNEFRTMMASWPPPAAVGFASGPVRSEAAPDAIQLNLRRTQSRLMDACQHSGVYVLPLVVANSAGHGPSAIRAAYDAGQRLFAEEHLGELLRKCRALPLDIAWHFSGPLDLNDVRPLLLGCPNLAVVEMVDSENLATLLNSLVVSMGRRPLKVYLPISFLKRAPLRTMPAKLLWELKKADRLQEVEKAKLSWYQESLRQGVAIGEELPLVQHIVNSCPGLQFAGLMTTGVGGMCTRAHFQNMVFSRRRIANVLALDETALQLCMGTGRDLELAIASGATSVRVGHEIFGHRPAVAEA